MNGRPALRVFVLIIAALAAGAAILLLASAVFFGAGKSVTMASTAGQLLINEGTWVALLIFLLVFPGWFILDALRKHAFLMTTEGATALMSMPVTAALLCVLLVVLQVTRAPNDVFGLVAFLVYAPAFGITVLDPSRRARALEWLRTYGHLLLLPALVSLCAICYLGVGLDGFDEVTTWSRQALRNLHPLPYDNNLNWVASQTWRDHLPVTALFNGGWRIGDRGPLYALLDSFLFRALEPTNATFSEYARLGIVLNSLFLAPLLLWIAALVGQRVGWLCTALVALNPWFFLNVYYTWPKLFGAYFLIAAVYLLWRRAAPATAAAFAAGGALVGLSGLAHVGGLLSVPLFYVVTVGGFVRSWRVLVRSLALPIVAVLVMVPWQLYKTWYSPESYKLFAANYLDDENTLPIRQNIQRFFREHGRAEQIGVREDHVRQLWWDDGNAALIVSFWMGRPIGGILYAKEFFAPVYSAGLTWFAWVVVGVPCALAGRALRMVRARAPIRQPTRWARWWRLEGSRDVSVWAVVAFVTISLTLNAALRWRPPFSHELPYAEVVLLAALILVCLARLGPVYLLLATVAVVARQVFYFQESARASALHLPAIDPFGVLFWLGAAGILALTIVVGRGGSSSGADAPTLASSPG